MAIRNLLCANLKRIWKLDNSMWCNIGQIYRITRASNQWFQSKGMSAEFQLIAEHDIECLLGMQGRKLPSFPKYSVADVRNFFPSA